MRDHAFAVTALLAVHVRGFATARIAPTWCSGHAAIARIAQTRRSDHIASMRLDFSPPEDEEADQKFAAEMAAAHAALDAAVDVEDYTLAQQLKVQMDAAVEARVAEKDTAWAAAAAATFMTGSPDQPTSMEALGGFRYDTSSTRSAAASSNVMSSHVRVDVEWTDELAELVVVQMINAFDNYPPSEVEGLLVALVEASSQQISEAEQSLHKLAGLARQMEALESAAQRGAGAPEYLEDEARSLRAQIRMLGKDGEKYSVQR